MKKTKITIIGRGNAGCFTALHYGYYLRKNKEIEIELIYDPDTPTEFVGQGTQLEATDLMGKALDICQYHNQPKATLKLGILYEGFGKVNEKIFHPFTYNTTSVHYEPYKVQDAILKSNLFSIKKQDIKDISNIDSTWVFDCRGKKINNYEEYDVLDSPVNAALLVRVNHRDLNQNWTRSVATPNGWTFIIPNVEGTTSYGYLFNKNLTTKEEAINNFNETFKLEENKVNLEEIKYQEFKNYIKKEMIKDNVIFSGNRLFFLEPLEATAVQAYLYWARCAYDHMFFKKSKEETHRRYKQYILELQNFINWHYITGSKFETPFWKESSKYKIEDPLFFDYLKRSREKSYMDLKDQDDPLNTQIRYGQWNSINFKNWDEGVNKKR